MTLASLDSCTDPATMVTSRKVRAQDRPARYSGAGEGDRGHYSGCEAPVVGGFVSEGEQLSVATGHIPKPWAWILVRVRDDRGSTAKEISFPRPTSFPPPVVGAEARASHRTTLAALGVVHGGEPSRPPRAHGCELVAPIWSASTAATRQPGNACQVRSGTVITGQCGLILLPSRCLEDQKGLTASWRSGL